MKIAVPFHAAVSSVALPARRSLGISPKQSLKLYCTKFPRIGEIFEKLEGKGQLVVVRKDELCREMLVRDRELSRSLRSPGKS